MEVLLKLAWRSLRRNRRRTWINIVAIAFALAVAVFFVSFGEGVYDQMIEEGVRIYTGHVTLEHPRYRDVPGVDLVVPRASRLRERIEALPGVTQAKLVVQGQGVARTGRGASGVAIVGVEPEREAATSPLARKLVRGTYLEAGDAARIVLGETLAERLHVRVGSKVVLSASDRDGELIEILLRVAGIYATGADDLDGYVVQIPVETARRLFGVATDEATQVGVLLDSRRDLDAMLPRLRALVSEREIAVRPWWEVLPELAAYIKVDRGSNLVFQGLLILMSLFTIFNTVLMSVLERTREFAVLLALGTPGWKLRAQILLESALLGAIGTMAGLLVGGALGLWMQVEGLDMTQLYPSGVTVSGLAISGRVHADVTGPVLGGLGGLVFVATFLTGALSVRHLRRIEIATILRQGGM